MNPKHQYVITDWSLTKAKPPGAPAAPALVAVVRSRTRNIRKIRREPPAIVSKAYRLARALIRWRQSGGQITPRDLLKRRLGPEGCGGCELWNAAGNLGLGACTAPGCGCTKFKAYLLSERCPHPAGSRWPKND